MPPILRVQFRPLLGGDWGEVRFTIKLNFIITLLHCIYHHRPSQVDVGATSEGGEVWGGLAQLLGLRPATQYEVIWMYSN